MQLGTQEDIASQLGIDTRSYANYKKLTTLIPELQELSLDNSISTSVASRVLARLSQDEQNKILEEVEQIELKPPSVTEVKQKLFKVDIDVLDNWNKFILEHKEYKVQSLISLALQEFIDKYK